ncbi:uncharacterized protein LOC120684590 [Panicum virgatum]|uniref:Uncharacterized protein n=1 Tax=Panicum virgatum TaxID=38727 RepID=A0A8T0PAI9_PANVG|nr:uncharacterized protein LOC120684590 [Panicum virgatum]XP_039822377.1 uncharacterized protein LOC120684590 [Panicum virgatum]XP_039822379.1 uncharacterized protein LOC120684590 [Panicum virgatum]XP_039822380.1 uncharacterized protein LOC120684590 [Panicum virgatum]XP_039822381.1 uncharacterized protein LOC120684590 [Panicum virgatum]KAG2557905.1 hypothetical protein PVAP13_8NG257200 [Panicum virgatum]
MDGAGLVAAAIATAAVYRLSSIRLADATTGRRRAVTLALAVALLLAVVESSRKIALRIEETEMKLLQMEEIIKDYEKQNHEMMSNLASILSNNPENIKSMSYNRSRSPDGTENTELTVTMKDADVHQPLTENGDTGEILEDADETVWDEAEPLASTPPPSSQGEAMGAQKRKPWRGFLIPPDHVFVLDCVDDELTVRIRPGLISSSGGLDAESLRARSAGCIGRQQQAGMVPFLYSAGRGRYALFMSPPEKQHVVPTMSATALMNRKLDAADLRGELESLIEKETEVVPQSFTLSPGVAAFCYRTKHGMTALIIVETDAVEHVELTEEVAARAVAALSPPGILFTVSFEDSLSTIFFKV